MPGRRSKHGLSVHTVAKLICQLGDPPKGKFRCTKYWTDLAVMCKKSPRNRKVKLILYSMWRSNRGKIQEMVENLKKVRLAHPKSWTACSNNNSGIPILCLVGCM